VALCEALWFGGLVVWWWLWECWSLWLWWVGDVYVEDGSSAGRERCSILIVEAESDGQLKIEGLMRSYW
jgi:hypothetical protein